MSNDKEKEIQYRLKVLSQIEPKGQAAQNAMEKVRETLAKTQKQPAGAGMRILKFIFSIQTMKFAAAAVILLGVGFIAGRLAIPKQPEVINMAQIQSMMDKKYAETAEKTLAASSTLMDQRINNVIGLIEVARETDRQWAAAAFDKIENDRRNDNARVGNSLIALAAYKKEIQPDQQN
jgi:hypothetical protein